MYLEGSPPEVILRADLGMIWFIVHGAPDRILQVSQWQRMWFCWSCLRSTVHWW